MDKSAHIKLFFNKCSINDNYITMKIYYQMQDSIMILLSFGFFGSTVFVSL